MKYRLETIPVWQAVEEHSMCPICTLADRLETQYTSFYVGDSVMTPEIRVTVNKRGFCPRHFQQMIEAGNKLGLSLMTATHIEALREKLSADKSVLARLAGRVRPRAVREYYRRVAHMRSRQADCLVCERMDHTMRNYAYTLARLHCDDDSFKEALRATGGVCLEHLPLICEVVRDALARGERKEFLNALYDLVDEDLSSIHSALGEFADRFDYRNSEPVTDELRAAVPKAIAKITGRAL